MSKLTDLLKAGDVKYLQRTSWENNKDYTVILKFFVDSNTVRQYVWMPFDTSLFPSDEVCELTLEEALADDWEIVELDV
ncbi:hypothetical protein falkor_61 [Salmonella phage falkor]|uniref:Uncharacterized protein n=12 Tax=Caudoviricetes TaxID=2731619 RepID=A0A6G8RCK0_9CAUD|nr:transcriptional regulator [Salmonella phage SH9]YP_009804400.1 transcriptional regulator [Salmonella phage LVR16A]YP_009824343.1 transcriptional regulator [Escherichia phage vB_Eco_mar003J3]YP_009857947.1 transcriptional regulator [Salmonella phage bombadil]ECJ3451718.1 hypothetical protein [Salmonella enterica]QDB70791.1 hypothetical protein SB6_121 [Salmonella phage vB_SenS_SB6]QIN99145.1 hypothetical protein phagemcphageface_53 [Salmonella phage phagemcphageface]QIO00334.1 hypothetical